MTDEPLIPAMFQAPVKRLDESTGQAPPRPFRKLYGYFNLLDRENKHRVHELRRSMSGMIREDIYREVKSIIASYENRNYDPL